MDQPGDYWRGRWERGETGWHQKVVEPELVENFAGLAPTRVLVPLCGKSRDMTWLAAQGHEVIGVELTELACRTFFEENRLSPTVTPQSPFQVFRAGKITLYCGDFFAFTPARLGTIGAIYDRAALIALPPELRVQYVSLLTTLAKACAGPGDFRFLQLLWEKDPPDSQGPPFSVSREQLEKYYQKDFDIRFVKREPIDTGNAERKAFQNVFRLSRRR